MLVCLCHILLNGLLFKLKRRLYNHFTRIHGQFWQFWGSFVLPLVIINTSDIIVINIWTLNQFIVGGWVRGHSPALPWLLWGSSARFVSLSSRSHWDSLKQQSAGLLPTQGLWDGTRSRSPLSSKTQMVISLIFTHISLCDLSKGPFSV